MIVVAGSGGIRQGSTTLIDTGYDLRNNAVGAADPAVITQYEVITSATADRYFSFRTADDDIISGAAGDRIHATVGRCCRVYLAIGHHVAVVAEDNVVPIATGNGLVADTAYHNVISGTGINLGIAAAVLGFGSFH